MAELMFKVPVEVEPKRDSRFIVEFPTEFNIESWCIQGATKPLWVNGEWQNIEIELIDPIGPSMSVAIVSLMEFFKKNKPGLFSKKKSLFSINIKSLDPTGVEVEKWTIGIEKLISVDFGSFHYGSDDIQKISIILKPSDCILKDLK